MRPQIIFFYGVRCYLLYELHKVKAQLISPSARSSECFISRHAEWTYENLQWRVCTNILLSFFVSFILILTPFYLLILGVESYCSMGPVAQSVATDYGLDGSGSNPGGDGIFPPVQTGPEAHPASCTMGTGSFPGVKCGRGVLLTTHPLLVPRSWKSRVIPVPTLWATPGL